MNRFFYLILIISGLSSSAQPYSYEPSEKFPFGKPHPDAPKEVADFEPMIGTCNCKSVTRIDQTTWADTVMMSWTFKYIMNGWGVQDMTLKEDGGHSGSIRVYNADSARWYVHYYSNKGFSSPLSTWEGNREDDRIVLYKDQKAPNGMDGSFRLTFSNFSYEGYNWVGEWVDKTEQIIYPTWRIFCRRDE